MDNDEVTRQTLAAWDEIQAEEQTAEEPSDEVEEADAGDEIEEPEEAEVEEPEDDDEGEEADEDEGEVEGEDQEEDQEPVVAAAYETDAVQEGAFELARAVCREWAREDPYSATRAGSYVDQAEAQVASYVEPIDMGRLLEAMRTEIPDMPNYSAQMTQVIHSLGDEHPLVKDARSGDIMVAAQAIARIYEYAKTSTATVTRAKQKVLDEQRQNGAVAKQRAVVSSASASPSATETPRPVKLGPGLTLEQLEAEFAR